MKIPIVSRVREMPPSGIRLFFELVIGMDDVISLGVGEPDFDTPWRIRETGIYSLEQGFTSYTSNRGLRELRAEISDFLRGRYGLRYDPDDEILVTVGVSEAVDLALRTILDRGDRFLVPQPCFVSYAPMTSLAGGEAVRIPLSETSGFKLTPALLRRHLGRDARGIILNYPSNPTGVSYRREELAALAAAIRRTRLTVLSDEIYDELTYDFEHPPFPLLPGMRERTIYLNGFSKAYAMTGWRIGYAAGPRGVIDAMTKIHQYAIMCAPTMAQVAACEALRRGGKDVREMKREYDRRRRLVHGRLMRMGLDCVRPDGAFYIFPCIRSSGLDSMEFSKRLLKEEKVAVVPGTAFGEVGEGFVRISYAASYENLKEALDRIERFLRRLRADSPRREGSAGGR
ncbi:MAG: aminotransferase class I/II-fold pyridoxal phosphate-dependent enzyme [Candidatus Aureabacteria bacterium]|nr:aminotransferase class I/II-fold pyridoxal phosphate-dependent enzyme [Candidatus Auribacterota bacterium]